MTPTTPPPAGPTITMRAMTHARKPRPRMGVAIVFVGFFFMTGEVARLWAFDTPVHPWVLAIGAFFAFAGYFIREPTRALQGGAFVVNSTIGIVSVIRTGRRATDPLVQVPIVTGETPQEFPAVKPGQPVAVDPVELPPPPTPGEKGD